MRAALFQLSYGSKLENLAEQTGLVASRSERSALAQRLASRATDASFAVRGEAALEPGPPAYQTGALPLSYSPKGLETRVGFEPTLSILQTDA